MRDIIIEKLNEIEEKENVTILYAAESGSRAWGFASADSDYDVRFIYLRREADYLRLDQTSDVIQWQLDDVLDISGWDLKKTLQLLYKSNPTIFEWCSSPIVYMKKDAFLPFLEILPQYFSPKKSMYHYWNTANTHLQRYFQEGEAALKKYFYVMRTLLATQWIYHNNTPPPMLLSELMGAELEPSIQSEVERLLEIKKETPEAGRVSVNPLLVEYIEEQVLATKKMAENAEAAKEHGWEELNQVFREMVKQEHD